MTRVVATPANRTRFGASWTRASTPGGSASGSPLFRFDSGMPQIGQLAGSARITFGCIGQ